MLEEAQAFIEALAKLWPRIEVVSTREAGVLWVRGKPRLVEPETWVLYWPIWTEVEWIEINPEPIDVPVQQLMLKHGGKLVPCAVDGVVEYHITDPERAICSCEDLRQRIVARAEAAIRNAFYGHTLAKLIEDEDAVEREMLSELRASMQRHGIKIDSFFLAGIATAEVHIHLGAVDTMGGT